MPTQTPNMGLWRWDNSNDAYDHSQLVANWNILDAHDHTGGIKGLQIVTSALASNAVTNAKIAAGAVTSASIANNTIVPTNIDPSVYLVTAPIGTIHWWWRPSNSTDGLPANWLVCDGSVVLAANHGFQTGGNSITLPDLRNHFVLGAALSGFGDGDADDPPGIGATGGRHIIDFTHHHRIPGHLHPCDPHHHTVEAHEHGISDHQHTISFDGAHDHRFNNGSGVFVAMQSQGVNSSIATTFQALTIPALNAGQSTPVNVTVETRGSHNHGGATGGVSGAIGPIVGLTDAQSPGTDDQILITLDNDEFDCHEGLEIFDVRSQWIGLLPIIKVKY